MVTFQDRDDAGRRLGELLKQRGLKRPLVLGIPRGGVPVAAQVARAVEGELGVVVARKVGAPYQPELAIGAVTADGVAWINEPLAADTGAGKDYLDREIAGQAAEARRREAVFDGHRRGAVSGRPVIIVDDGIATGATALAAARSMRKAGAKPLIVAVPVGPPHTLDLLKQEADEVICLHEEPDFWAIGQFYVDFHPMEDREVLDVLAAFPAAAPDGTVEAFIRRDGVELAARLRLPGGRAPVVVFVHGLGSSKDSPRNVVIAERLVDAGIAALLFDLSGHGESTAGRHEGIEAYVDDLVAAVAWVKEQPGIDAEHLAIAGSSLGAVVALQAVQSGRVKPAALVLRAPPADPEEFRGLTVPALLLVGSDDPLLEQACGAAGVSPSVRLQVAPGASHLFEEPGTLELATDATVSWLRGQLAAPAAARA
ncbi:MAG: alpha/beta fold hydrolase [Chloroflexi bacterium]|nr:alpha/beta fold hydrolase [Chloroflexota bacterium]